MPAVPVANKIKNLFKFIGDLYAMKPQYELKVVEYKIPFIFKLAETELNMLSKRHYAWNPSNGNNEDNKNDIIFSLVKPNLPPVPDDLRDFIRIKNKKIVEIVENIPEKEKIKIREFSEKVDKIKNTQMLFDDFYNKVYMKMENDASYDLFLGRLFLKGNVTIEKNAIKIDYPLLLQEVCFKDLGKDQKIIVTDKQEQKFALKFRNKDTEVNDILLKKLELYNEHIRALPTDILTENIAEQYKGAISNIIGNDERIDITVDEGTEWVLFLRKKQIDYKSIAESLAEHVETQDSQIISPALKTIIGEGEYRPVSSEEERASLDKLAFASGYCEDVLFPIPTKANKAQVDIAKKLDNDQIPGIVLQGPPGTGKTQTIANITGHLMAQGKRILITSATNKALTVLRDKLPDDLKNYCVTDLATDVSSVDMLSSAIDTIVGDVDYYQYENNQKKTENEINSKEKIRKDLLKKAKEIRENIQNIRMQFLDSFCPISLEGKGYNSKNIAQYIADNKNLEGLIPGKVEIGKTGLDLPLTLDEVNTLYQTNSKINPEEETSLRNNIPNYKEILNSLEIRNLFTNLESSYAIETKLKEKLKNIIEHLFDTSSNPWQLKQSSRNHSLELIDFLRKLQRAVNNISLPKYDENTERYLKDLQQNIIVWQKKEQNWHKDVIVSESIEDYQKILNLIQQIIPNYHTRHITYSNSYKINREELLDIKYSLSKKGKLKWYDFSAKKCLNSIKINGENIISAEEIDFVLKDLNRRDLFAQIKRLSNIQGINIEDSLQEVRTVSKDIQELLGLRQCYKQHLSLTPTYCNFHIPLELLQSILDTDGKELFWKVVTFIFQCQQIFIELSKNIEFRNICLSKIENTKKILTTKTKIPLCQNLLIAIENKNFDNYELLFNKLVSINSKKDIFDIRIRLLNKLKPYAPQWVSAIEQREGCHSKDIFSNVKEAWKYKQFQTILERYNSLNLDTLYSDLKKINADFVKVTKSLVVDKTKLQNAKRIIKENDKEIISSLRKLPGFKSRLGKGKGRRHDDIRRNIAALRAKCSSAVPVWIMHIDTALKQMDLKHTVFDLIIIDEASQAELNSLLLLTMAKKVLIVGDEKQTTPSSRNDRLSQEQLNTLKQEYHIKEIFGQEERFDRTYSIYEMAYEYNLCPDSLREHFRCAPDIIEFCNKNFYSDNAGKGIIIPLRNTSTIKRKPSLKTCFVAGSEYDEEGRNEKEAKEIISLIAACCEQKEYEDATFGVIALHGIKQAQLINDMLIDKLKDKCIKHKILCGIPSEFQGDERDVIFLSMEYTPQRISRKIDFIGDNKKYAKAYNVAVSRARDQIWLIRSLQVADLQEEDCRRILLEYFEQNTANIAYEEEQIFNQCESPFEKEVCQMLFKYGYRNIIPQYKVSGYRIDFVVKDDEHSVAIECDGDKYHSGLEKVYADMERQEILERCGWQFIRIPGHKFYSDKEGTINNVVKELQKYKVFPDRKEEQQTITDLEDRICVKAQEFKNEFFNKEEE